MRASLYPALPVLFRRGRGRFVQDGHTEKLRIDGPIVKLANRLAARRSQRAWSAGCSRNRAIRRRKPKKLATRPWSELNWPGRISPHAVPRGPIAVALHCLVVKGLIFDGTAGLLYTAQRVTADLILSMHLLRRDLDR